MAKLTPESFLNVVKQSKLLTKDKIKSLITEMQGSGVDCKSTSTIAAWLVGKGLLTDWQVEKLKQARHKGFFLGKYRLLQLLGKGGMSSVYLAEHTLMRRRCAVKVLPIKKVHDSSYLARFHREAQAVASLDHPNIVRAYDIDHEVEQDQEIHFLVMEYVKGHSLHELVTANGPLQFEVAVDFMEQAAQGLDHAHRSGLIHRDVKPANLLVDESGVVKVLDLGLALFSEVPEENPLTVAHDEQVLGTADFLSPEQALDSHKVDARADIYSLGCTAYFMLTGRPPFNEGSIAQRLMWHQTKDPPPISTARSDTPDSLAKIIQRTMMKSPDDRFQSMSELAVALKKWLAENASSDWRSANGQSPGSASTSHPKAAFPVVSTPASVLAIDDDPLVGLGGATGTDSQVPSDASFNSFLANLGGGVADPQNIPPTRPTPPMAAPVISAQATPAAVVPTAPLKATPAPPIAVPVAARVAPVALPVPVATPVGVPVAKLAVTTTPDAQVARPATTVTPPAVALPVVAKPVVVKPVDAPPRKNDAAAPFLFDTDEGDDVPMLELEKFDESDPDDNLAPDFMQQRVDDDSQGGFPSLFSGADTHAEHEKRTDAQATVSEHSAPELFIPEPFRPAHDPRYDDATIITPYDRTSSFPELPAQAESFVPAAPKQKTPVVVPATPIAAPIVPVPSNQFATFGQPVAASNDLPNFANFGQPAQPAFVQPGVPVGRAVPSSQPTFAPSVSPNAFPAKADQPPMFGEPSDATTFSSFSSRPTSASKSTARGRAKAKLPILEIFGGLVIAAIAVGCYFYFTGGNKTKNEDGQQQAQGDGKDSGQSGGSAQPSTGSSGVLKMKLEVGPDSEFKSIGAALSHIRKDKSRYGSLPRRSKILVEVAGGASFSESISIDNSDGSYPRGIHIVGTGSPPKLKGSGVGPAVRIQGAEFFGLENFEIDAAGSDVAIELSGYLNLSRLFNLKVSGYKQNGLLGKGVTGVSNDYVVLEKIEFKPNGSSTSGMLFTDGQAPTGRVRILGCKFLGPTSAGINLDGGINYFELRENIFEKSDVGVQLGKTTATWRNLSLMNNTFYQGKIGIAFGAMPASGSSEFVVHRNLFAGLSGPELVIQDGFDDMKFDKVLATISGVDMNFSDRKGVPDISAGERDIVIAEERRVGTISFASTSPSSEEFLATQVSSPYGRIGAPKMGSKPYIGAVAPR